MSKLSKAEAKLHKQACELVNLSRPLTLDERLFILENWQESANHVNSAAGTFFTPTSLARDLSIYVPDGGKILDLCAGIGMLSYHAIDRHPDNSSRPQSITCVEINPDYVVVGSSVVPEAQWFCGDVFDPEMISELESLAPFDCVISNPPFGRAKNLPLAGVALDLNIVALAARLSRYGVFILPQASCPFEFSGRQGYNPRPSDVYDKFHQLSGIHLDCSSIDCELSRQEWRGVAPKVEIVTFDLDETREVLIDRICKWAGEDEDENGETEDQQQDKRSSVTGLDLADLLDELE